MPWRKTGGIVIFCASLVFADVKITSIGKGSNHATCKYEKSHEQGVHGNIGAYRKKYLTQWEKDLMVNPSLEPQIVHINYEGGS